MKKALCLSAVLCLIAGAAFAADAVKIGLMCPLTCLLYTSDAADDLQPV